jgi:hypothetical protein
LHAPVASGSVATRWSVMVLTLSGFLTVRPAIGFWQACCQDLDTSDPASTQSCNTRCQEEQTDCAIKCDQNSACIQVCRSAAQDCVRRCITTGSADSGAPLGPDAGSTNRDNARNLAPSGSKTPTGLLNSAEANRNPAGSSGNSQMGR